jgi:hypothetical protein
MFHNCIKLGLIFGLILFIGFGNLGYADPVSSPDPDDRNANMDISAGTDGYRLRVGEILDYDVWAKSIIRGGQQTLRILSQDVLQERDVLHVQYTLKTIGVVQSFTNNYFIIEDLVIDREGIYPLSIRREIHQGKLVTVDEVSFDYTKGIATRSFGVNDSKRSTYPLRLPGIVQDAVSLQLSLRKGGFQKGVNRLYFYNNDNGTIEETYFLVSEGSTPLKLECGTYSDYYKFEDKGGKITILIAQDANRTPLIIRFLASFGKVEAKLAKIQ